MGLDDSKDDMENKGSDNMAAELDQMTVYKDYDGYIQRGVEWVVACY